jgi:hypothetical protein
LFEVQNYQQALSNLVQVTMRPSAAGNDELPRSILEDGFPLFGLQTARSGKMAQSREYN